MNNTGRRHGGPAVGIQPQRQNDRSAAVSQAQQEIWDLILREQRQRRATENTPNPAQRQNAGGDGPRGNGGQQATRAPAPRQQNRDRFAAQREQMQRDEELARRLSEGVDQGPLGAPVPLGRRPAPRAAPVPPASTAAPRAPTAGPRAPTAVPHTPAQTPAGAGAGSTTGSECSMCLSTPTDGRLFRAPCTHEMCIGCLEKIFRRATRENQHYPPRCCPRIEIPVNTVRHLLPAELIRTLEQKAVEFTTDNPTHCSNRQCSAFIPPAHIRETVARCLQCRSQTCVMCKEAHHPGRDCPHDPGKEQMEALADQRGWVRCPQCKQMVDRAGGCCHIM